MSLGRDQGVTATQPSSRVPGPAIAHLPLAASHSQSQASCSSCSVTPILPWWKALSAPRSLSSCGSSGSQHAASPLHSQPTISWHLPPSLRQPLSLQQWRGTAQLSRVKVPKSAGINDTLVPNTTTLKYGSFGIRAMTGKRVAANTIEAVRRCGAAQVQKSSRVGV